MADDKGAGEGSYRVVQPVDITPLTVEGPMEIANGMEKMLQEIWSVYVPSHAPGFQMKFDAWKKARGIE